ncbi:MAG: hypothetical protein JWL66_747 [Sphingomonadales bacterium]|nr:hypothetical protein [Sphingomonadales bacterium]
MSSFREPTFQDRVGRAAEAKQKALSLLRAKPPVDAAAQAELRAAQLAREAAQRAESEAKRAALQQEKAEKRALAEQAQAAEAPVVMTEEERKAIRDAKYAARKKRK